MYGLIYTDPPWPQTKGNARKCRPNQGKELDYKTMSLQDIEQYHRDFLATNADEKHNVFCWTIDKFMRDTEKMFENLGYKWHCIFIWNKMNGIAPAFTVRFTHEYLYWFYKPGNILLPDKGVIGKYTTLLEERSTVHSKKPECAYLMLEDMFPNVNKVELFARQRRDGWDSLGDEL